VTGVRIATFPVGPLQCNCTILMDETSKIAVVIDPGDESDRILRELKDMDARPIALLHTHAHFDHIGGSSDVARATKAALRLHEADRLLWEMLPQQASLFGMAMPGPLPIDAPIEDGEHIAFGAGVLRAIHTPGHTPGSTCFLLESGDRILFSGDTLFHRSIGRTDLWGGDSDQIAASIQDRLYTLPPDTPVVCGHGEGTTIGAERSGNPFVRARA
jgi:hydroxyacylglutathione hydrolase